MPRLEAIIQSVARRPQRITLLEQIAELGSISRAAKAAGMSYKAAWDAIDELNNLSPQPLVSRSVGGKGGGGAQLTASGERLLALHQRLQQMQQQVLKASEDAEDLQWLGRLMLRTSARNQLLGRVTLIDHHGLNDLISLELSGGAIIQARITRDSTEALELVPDNWVLALFKAGWVDVQAADHPNEEGLNRLEGSINQITPAEGSDSEVRLQLSSGQTLCALVAPEQLQQRGLQEGSRACALFAPTHVLLGTPI